MIRATDVAYLMEALVGQSVFRGDDLNPPYQWATEPDTPHAQLGAAPEWAVNCVGFRMLISIRRSVLHKQGVRRIIGDSVSKSGLGEVQRFSTAWLRQAAGECAQYAGNAELTWAYRALKPIDQVGP